MDGKVLASCTCKSDMSQHKLFFDFIDLKGSLFLILDVCCPAFQFSLGFTDFFRPTSCDVIILDWTRVMVQIKTPRGYFCASTLRTVISQRESMQVNQQTKFYHPAKFTFVRVVTGTGQTDWEPLVPGPGAEEMTNSAPQS